MQKSGAWFSFNGERLGQGRDNVKEYFRSHPDFAAKIEKQVYDNAGKLYAKTAPGSRGSCGAGQKRGEAG